MRIFVGILNFIEKLFRLATSCLFVVMVASIAYQIVLRYVFSRANSWSEELARYSFVWLVMLAACLGARHGRHMCIEFLVERFPAPLRTVVALGTRLLATAFFVVLGYKGAELFSFTLHQHSTGLEIPMAYVYLAIPVGAFVMCLFSVEDILRLLKKRPFLTVSQEGGV